jgi:hypothetical protein
MRACIAHPFGRYYERVLRAEEATIDIVTYIVESPVRGGIVRQPFDYPHLGSGVYTREQLRGFWIDQHR